MAEVDHEKIAHHMVDSITTLFIPMAENLAEGAKDQAEQIVDLVAMTLKMVTLEKPEDRIDFAFVVLNKIGEIARIGQQQMDRANSMVESHLEDWKAHFPDQNVEESS